MATVKDAAADYLVTAKTKVEWAESELRDEHPDVLKVIGALKTAEDSIADVLSELNEHVSEALQLAVAKESDRL